MVKISFELGALITGALVWGVLGVGIVLQNGFLIVISTLTLGLVISVWIVIITANINEWLTKRKFHSTRGVNQIVNNYVSYIDENALNIKNTPIKISSEEKL
ncbi:MAG: hypothetical protein ACFFD1_06755 [Candidatus Thorarchaeota archaeon]